MSNYTITIQEMIDLQIPIFNEEFETAVASYYQVSGKFNATKWAYLKKRFIQHYKYREIGFETIDLFYDYCLDVFEDNIEKFLILWNTDISDPLSNNKSTIERDLLNADLPFTPLQDLEDYASTKQNEKVRSSSISNSSEMEQLKKFNNNYQDIDNQFIMLFNDLFMSIYEL